MIEKAIVKIVDKQDLTYDEAYEVISEIMSGKTSATQNAAFLAALSTKSTKAETIDEIAGCAAAMRDAAMKFENNDDLLEIVGTGGDNAHSFNISTTSAMVIAASGIKVAKHGNRAASSLSGTADCLEALGVNIRQEPDKAREMLDKTNFCFFFAQLYHTSMKYVGPIRKELGIRTVFNILGPLTNPSSPKKFLLGVYDASLVEPLAQVLMSLGVERGMVVTARISWTRYPYPLPPTSASSRTAGSRATTSPRSSSVLPAAPWRISWEALLNRTPRPQRLSSRVRKRAQSEMRCCSMRVLPSTSAARRTPLPRA